MSPRRTSRYTPQNRAELVACLVGLGDGQTVEVKPTAAELLRPRKMHTVKEVLDLPDWPYGRLRIVIEQRWRFIEVAMSHREPRPGASPPNIAKLPELESQPQHPSRGVPVAITIHEGTQNLSRI